MELTSRTKYVAKIRMLKETVSQYRGQQLRQRQRGVVTLTITFLLLAFPAAVFSEGIIFMHKYSIEEAKQQGFFVKPSCLWVDRCQIKVRVPSNVDGYRLSTVSVIRKNLIVPMNLGETENDYVSSYFMVKNKDTKYLKVQVEYLVQADSIHWNTHLAEINLSKLKLRNEPKNGRR